MCVLCFLFVSAFIYFCLSVWLSVCPFVCMSVCLSVHLSVSLSVCLSICLSVFLFVSTVGHHLFDTQLSDSMDYPKVHGLSELQGCPHARVYDSCAYSTVFVVHVSSN